MSSLLPVPDMGEGVEWPFEIPIRSGQERSPAGRLPLPQGQFLACSITLTHLPNTHSSPLRSHTLDLLAGLLLLLTWGCEFGADDRNDGGNTSPGAATAKEFAQPRLAILYIPCTLNRGYLSTYNEAVPYTPALEAFGRESLVFQRHQTEAGQSGLAYSSIFSGSQADRHGVYLHPGALDENLYTITEAFRDAGYDTYFWAGQPMARRALGGQGLTDAHVITRGLKANDPTLTEILDRLVEDPEYKAFIVTASMLTHAPYSYRRRDLKRFCANYPEECEAFARLSEEEVDATYQLYRDNMHSLMLNFPETAQRLNLEPEGLERLITVLEMLYKSNVNLVDRRFGELIEVLRSKGLYQSSIIAFTADHGEARYREHSLFKWSHGQALHPEVITVPWMVRAPDYGVAPGLYENVTRSTDVFPTIAALASVPGPSRESRLDGVDLSSAVRGITPSQTRVAYSHTGLTPRSISRQSPQWTLFHSLHPGGDADLMWVMVRQKDLVVKIRNIGNQQFQPEAYDLARDPFESRNLFNPNDPQHRKLYESLERYKATLVEHAERRMPVNGSESIEDQEKILRSLGYIQ